MSSAGEAAGPGEEEGTVLGQGFIVALLVGAMVLLYWFAPPRLDGDGDLAATAMLALGFVVLASFTVGHLAETVGLPHITGYLVAGVFLGPSFAELLPSELRVAPFDQGVLEPSIIGQIGLLDSLAVALIALTAGGELRIDALRKGIRAILSVLAGQVLATLILIGGFVLVVSGAVFPGVVLPGLVVDGIVPALALGSVVAAISMATSPAATIAVINGAEASGPMTRLVLSTVVLKDVVVVVAFSVATVLASQVVLGGGGGSDQDLIPYLTVHVGGSLVAGGAIGFAMALYLRFVDREVLLFLVAVVYVATFLATRIDLDPVLLFISAGFAAANFSRQGEHLVHSVEKLSGPVYVVFFTLAGARLHLDEVAAVAPFALALVLVRTGALALGTVVGAQLGGADPATRRHGWLGFVSQAGVALSLASLVGDAFGEPGAALQTLLIAGVALNELLGPVLLKVGLGFAGEIPRRAGSAEAEPGPEAGPSDAVDPAEVDRAPETGRAIFRTPALVEAVGELGGRVATLTRRVTDEEIAPRRRRAELLLGEVRRDALRLHRRLLVAARGTGDAEASVAEGEDAVEGAAGGARLDADRLREEVRALAQRVRDDLAAAADEVRDEDGPVLFPYVAELDHAVAACPERLDALYEPIANPPLWRRALAVVLRRGEPRRRLPLQELARYHLWGRTVARLPEVQRAILGASGAAAAPVAAALDRAAAAYGRAVGDLDPTEPDDPDESGGDEEERGAGEPEPSAGFDAPGRIARARGVVEAAVTAAEQEVAAAFDEATRLLEETLETGLQAVEADLLILGTRWLSPRRRKGSLVFPARAQGIRRLEEEAIPGTARAAGALDGLALALDLQAFTAAVRRVQAAEVARLAQDVRGKTETQLVRLAEALDQVRPALAEIWQRRGEASFVVEPGASEELRVLAEPVLKVMTEAEDKAVTLLDRLSAPEDTLAPLRAALDLAARELGRRYERPTSPDPEASLVEVPLRERVGAEVEGPLTAALTAALREVAAEVDPLVDALRENRRLSVLNVELAAGELEIAEGGETPLEGKLLRQLIEPGLDRAAETTSAHLETSRHLASRLARSLDEALENLTETLTRELAGERMDAAALGALRRSIAPPPPNPLDRTPGGAADEDRPGAAASRWHHPIRQLLGIDRSRETAPGAPIIGAPRTGLDDPRLHPTPIAPEIPLAYRKLFAGEALEAGEAAFPSDLDAGDLARELARERGRLRTLALVGPPGVGQVAALRAMARSRSFPDAVRVWFDGPADADDVAEALAPIGQGRLVLLRGVEWLARPGPAGLRPLDVLVRRILDDEGRNAWALAADTLPFAQAAALSPLGDAFPRVVPISPMDGARLRRALLGRHALSGHELAFADGEGGAGVRAGANGAGGGVGSDGESVVTRRQERFFEAIHRGSGGRVRDALGLWLGSIDRVDDLGTVVLRPPNGGLRETMLQLADPDLLELYAVERWGWIDAAGLAESLRIDPLRATARLERWSRFGILERSGRNGRTGYRVGRHLRGWLTDAAVSRGWGSR